MDDLVNRLRGLYAMGPHLPNGEPEFGFRQFEAPPIQHEAASEIERLRAALRGMLMHSCVADAGPDMKDPEDHAAETAALLALDGKEEL